MNNISSFYHISWCIWNGNGCHKIFDVHKNLDVHQIPYYHFLQERYKKYMYKICTQYSYR